MATTLTQARTIVQLLTQQVAADDLSAAHIDFYLEDALRWWFDHTEKRVKDVQLKGSMAANSWIVTPETSVVYPEIVEAYLVGSSGDTELPLEVRPWSEIRARQQANSTQAQPTQIALRRIGGADPLGTDQNLWEFAPYPIPDATYEVRALVRDYPTIPTLAGSNFSGIGDYEVRCVAVLASILAAPGSARPDLAASLMWFFPQALRDKIQAHLTREEVVA